MIILLSGIIHIFHRKELKYLIKHEGKKWVLYSKDGSKKLGEHNTEEKAKDQEAAIEASEAKKKKTIKESFFDFINKFKEAAIGDELDISESMIPADIREGLLQGSLEAIQSDVRQAVESKNVQGFCNCSTASDRSESSWSTLNVEGTFMNGTVAVSCWKCRNWWIANWSKNDQGQVVFSNIKPAAQVVVAMEANRNGTGSTEAEEIQIDESAVTLREGLGMDESGIIKDACLIQPGWGSSGYYGADVLQKEAASFSGLQMFVDHPTSIEETTLPERSVKNLAAVVTGTTFKEGWKGAGIYGDVKVFSDFQEPIKEKAPFIGLSLYGRGKAKVGEAEGKTGKIIESIPYKRSVDFVTKAGAGGALMPLLESTRKLQEPNKPNESSHKDPVKESRTGSEVVVIKESKDKELIEVPVTEQEFTELKETVSKVVAENASLKESIVKVTSENGKLKEKDMIREAQTIVTNLVESAKVPQVTKNRLNTELVDTPLTEVGELDKAKLTENVKAKIAEAEAEIAAIVGSGKVVGMGGSGNEPTSIKESIGKEMDKMFGYEEPEKK
jgi:hypothetical protein